MLLQIFLVKIWLISVPCDGAINRAVQGEQSGQPLRGLTLTRMSMRQSRSERNTSLRSEIEANDNVSGVNGSDEVFVLNQLAKYLPPVTALAPHKRDEIIENWRKDQERVISLYKDSKDLLNIHSEIQAQFEWMKENGKVQNSKDFLKVIDLVHVSQETISIFKQLKLFELGKVDLKISNWGMMATLISKTEIFNQIKNNDNHDHSKINGTISRMAWQNAANMFLDEVKKLIIDYSHQFKILDLDLDSYEAVILWKYVFKIIDFLLNQGFISQDSVREILQEDKMVEQIIFYASARFENEIKEDIWVSFTSLTEHCYWPLLNDCFKVLGEKGKRILNFSLILKRINVFGQELYHNKNNPEWETFSKYFSAEKYMNILKERDESKSELNISKIQQDDLERFTGDIKNLVNLLKNYHNIEYTKKTMLNFYTWKFLEFIEVELFPGILKKEADELNLKMESYDHNLTFISLSIKIVELGQIATSYLKIFGNETGSEEILLDDPIVGLSNYKNYHERALELFPILKDSYSKVCLNYHKSSSWLMEPDHIHYVFHQCEEVLNQFKSQNRLFL